MSMGSMLVATKGGWTATVLRLVLGLVMFPHGAQKVLGWFGGYGFEGTMGFFTGTLHIPAVFAFLAIAAEFGGSLLLIAGAATRLAALGIGVTMVVAALKVHVGNGFFMNWYGNQAGEGFEYHILAAGIALALLIAGGGKASVDEVLARKVGERV